MAQLNIVMISRFVAIHRETIDRGGSVKAQRIIRHQTNGILKVREYISRNKSAKEVQTSFRKIIQTIYGERYQMEIKIVLVVNSFLNFWSFIKHIRIFLTIEYR